MEPRYTLIGWIFCKWLGWHWPNKRKAWKYGGQTHASCRLCGLLISRASRRDRDLAAAEARATAAEEENHVLRQIAETAREYYVGVKGRQALRDALLTWYKEDDPCENQ